MKTDFKCRSGFQITAWIKMVIDTIVNRFGVIVQNYLQFRGLIPIQKKYYLSNDKILSHPTSIEYLCKADMSKISVSTFLIKAEEL